MLAAETRVVPVEVLRRSSVLDIILQVDLEDFAKRLEVGFEGNRGVNNELQSFGSNLWKNGSAISPKGREYR